MRNYADATRILLSPEIASRKGILLRLAEPLARDGIAVRPLDLYGAIVNDRFSASMVVPGDPSAAVIALLTSAVSRATVSLAVTARALRIGEDRKVRLLLLIAAPERDADLCRDLIDEALVLLSDPERLSALVHASNAGEAWRVLRGRTDA